MLNYQTYVATPTKFFVNKFGQFESFHCAKKRMM